MLRIKNESTPEEFIEAIRADYITGIKDQQMYAKRSHVYEIPTHYMLGRNLYKAEAWLFVNSPARRRNELLRYNRKLYLAVTRISTPLFRVQHIAETFVAKLEEVFPRPLSS